MNHEITITQFAREKCHPSFEAFDQKDMELFYRGYPNLVVLKDDHPDNKKWKDALIKMSADSDLVYKTEWPSRVALAFAHTYPIESGKESDKKNPVRAEYLALLEKTEIPDENLLREKLRLCMPGREGSIRSIESFIYIYEYYLGAETVALAFLDRLNDYTDEQWTLYELIKLANGEYEDSGTVDDFGYWGMGALGYLMLRASDEGRALIQEKLNQLISKRPSSEQRTVCLGYLPDKAVPIDYIKQKLELAFMRELTTNTEIRWQWGFFAARVLFLDGPDRLSAIKDVQFGNVDELGKIKHPQVVRLLVGLAAQRKFVAEVVDWINAHKSYVDSVLPQFEKDAFVKKGLVGIKKYGPVAKTEALSEDEAFGLVKKEFLKLNDMLPSIIGSQKKLNSAFIEAARESAQIGSCVSGADYPLWFFHELYVGWDWGMELTKKQFDRIQNAFEQANSI